MRYIAYARFSPRRDADKCPSCLVQLEDIRRWILAASPGAEIIEFSDEDVSGKTLSRPALQAALKAMKRGDVLIVRDWDRAARNLYAQLKLARMIDQKKAEMRAIYGGPWRDVKDPAIRLLSNMLASVAEYQRELTSLKTSKKMLRHQAEGRCMGSKPPFGKKIKIVDGKKRLITVLEEQETIKRIFELRDVHQFVWTQIARTLGNEGRKISGSKIWAPNVVRRIYKRESTIG
jgi:site-specific DNA recombinase